jgi:hypothetical protein
MIEHTPGPWYAGPHSTIAGRFAIRTGDTTIGHTWDEANARLIAAAPDLLEALKAAVMIAEEAHREWDAAPDGMRAGKIIIALAGGRKGYRQDIDAIHAAVAKAEGRS